MFDPEVKASFKNRLAGETSPYLLQHADNPVGWYPWGEEAIEKARREDKPIFLSIGYSACHWCHVMEKESFENQEIAAILNKHFVPIKVDREERPDLDAIYMKAVQMMTGSGGWPLNVFLTPELKPFFGGTYFPPENRHGYPGFKELLLNIADLYKQKKAAIKEDALSFSQKLAAMSQVKRQAGFIRGEVLSAAAPIILAHMDPRLGGFGGAPKFPSPPALFFLLRHGASARPGAKEAMKMLEVTLDSMAAGGIYDHLGGGFHRYSTDERWFAPHFEKMLYDNAQLARLYVEAWQISGKRHYRKIAEETLDYLLREMRQSQGGFYSSQDADSEGVEGKFYAWTWPEITEALAGDKGDLGFVKKNFHAAEQGNWEDGRNIFYADPLDSLQEKELVRIRKKLFVWRVKNKIPPARDEKILTDWNSLAISAFSYAAGALGRADYLDAAKEAVRFILDNHRDKEGRLLHTRAGQKNIAGLLEDYAYFSNALIDLYEASFDLSYLYEAQRIGTLLIDLFYDSVQGDFFSFPKSGGDPNLLTNIKESYDGVTPSGNAAATLTCLRLGRYFEQEPLRTVAENVLRGHIQYLESQPLGATAMLANLEIYLEEPWQIEITGSRQSKQRQELARVTRRFWWPSSVMAALEPESKAPAFPWSVQISDKVKEKPKVYLCRGKNCLLPTADPKELEAFLKENLKQRVTP